MPSPKKPNTTAAVAARRDPAGRMSRPVRVLTTPDVHELIQRMTPAQIGSLISDHIGAYVSEIVPVALPERIVLSELAELPFERMKVEAPEIPAVYIIQRDGDTAYVGQTNNLRVRWNEHSRRREFEGMMVRWVPVSAYEDRLSLEGHLIQSLRPTHPSGAKKGMKFSRVRQKLDIPVI